MFPLPRALCVRRGALRRGVRRHRERVVGAEARVSDWAAFVRYAEMEHKAQFFRALTPASGELCCEGTLDGAPCPKNVRLDLRDVSSSECGAALPGLHMDHTHDEPSLQSGGEVGEADEVR